MSQAVKIVIAAALLTLSACNEIPRTPQQLVCTTDGEETYRSHVTYWINQPQGKDSWNLGGEKRVPRYMPKPGELCEPEKVTL